MKIDIGVFPRDKAVGDVDLKPTQGMRNAAERGLRNREEYGRGGTQVGVARARDISNGDNLSPETVRRMHSFFSRHRVDLDAPAAKPGHEDYPSAGRIAWDLWGGDAGARWAARKVEELERAEGKNDKSIKNLRSKAIELAAPDNIASAYDMSAYERAIGRIEVAVKVVLRRRLIALLIEAGAASLAAQRGR